MQFLQNMSVCPKKTETKSLNVKNEITPCETGTMQTILHPSEAHHVFWFRDADAMEKLVTLKDGLMSWD